ncbi:Methylmalonyl-CoA epimerase [Acididesulfobacillus acetoxydans]|uniref:Methylmalonyl-CoA epimerase n=1 Tax=Acididesulfobacillus acetoxydans TaxID=1561005 RepID=A0A8S0X5N3_9FIRM|nr:methylmalonyl-CoA epimerase [Acididesulfobacillus acetoxydans]CAA7601810.1 Methylmalonyl-CoA epimerase [Acididesulfobacillus acetoxydans]CEJ09230.1 Methylmalonyl-CoA epimerase [Acididesulfobacillus acetoxydans]
MKGQFKPDHLDHIGIAVADLEEALNLYERLGLICEGREEVPGQKVNTAVLPLGRTRLELLQPTQADSPIGKFLAQRGPGVHHLALAVEDIEGKLRELKEQGFRVIDEEPRPGAGGSRVAFLHPKGTLGTLIELVERS